MIKDLEQGGKSPEELRREREQRITDVINLKIPDRVPVVTSIGYFAAKYAGIPCSAAYYNCDKWFYAYRKTLKDFQPDMVSAQIFSPGKALEYLNPNTMRWPGYGVDSNCGHQSIEVDSMRDDEYNLFLTSPADFLMRYHLPRTHENLEGLSMFPKLSDIGWFEPWSGQKLAMFLTEPKIEEAIKNLQKAGHEFRKWQPKMMEFNQMLLDYGFPQFLQDAILPPFDVVSHGVRGMKGTMLDMFRQPDKLLELCEYILEQSLERPLREPNEYGNLRVFMTNTRGSDNFMSTEQFNRFYWPTFKRLVLNLVDRGATPCIFFEGKFTSRLEHLLEFPKGKVLVRLDSTDIFRAKEILKDHLCIEGNVPSTLLQVGTVEDVKEHCKKLIDVVGKGGGFILAPRSSTDEVKPENLKAMIEFTKEYGRY